MADLRFQVAGEAFGNNNRKPTACHGIVTPRPEDIRKATGRLEPIAENGL